MTMFCLDCECEFIKKDVDICPFCFSVNIEELPDYDVDHFEGDFKYEIDLED